MALIQFGQQFTVGLGDYEFTGTVADAGDYEHAIDETVYFDADNEPVGHMMHGAYKVITITGIVKSTGYTKPDPGDLVTINGVEAPVVSCQTKPDRLAHKMTLRVKAFDSINYSP